jgi:hypothetical protein
MGKASKKKAERRQGASESRAEFEERRQESRLAAAFERLAAMNDAEDAETEQAARAWCGGARPTAADIPRWAKGSVGDHFFTAKSVRDAARAPRLATAVLPTAETMAADPAHWRVAAGALVRAVVLDGVPVSEPAVAAVADLLAPAVAAEIEYDTDETFTVDFPDLSGPLFLIGGVALFDATEAIVGADHLAPVLAVLQNRLDAAFEPLGLGPGVTGASVGAALICALHKDYVFEDPDDAELLAGLDADSSSGNALESLVVGKSIAPEDAIRTGLAVLADLASLCRTDALSIVPQGT